MLFANCIAVLSFVSFGFGDLQDSPKQQDSKKPAPDRSGEPLLRKAFEATAKLKGVHVLIIRSNRDEDIGAMYPDVNRELWYDSASKFRYETFGYWGDSTCYVADGEKVIVDGRDSEVPVVYRDLKPNVYESSVSLNQRGGDTTLFTFLLAGEKGMNELVKKDGYIKSIPSARDEVAVRFESTQSGTVTFYWKVSNEIRVHRIEYDNRDYFMEQHRQYPEWVAEPIDPLTREDVLWLSVGKGFDKKLFEVSKRPGMTIDDQRTKKGGSPKLRTLKVQN